MRKFLTNCALYMGIATLMVVPALASAQENEPCNHSTGKTDDTFFGGARFILTPVFVCEDTAFSLLGEAGSNNYRVNGTFGSILESSRFKVGAEYLSQKIKYNLPNGVNHHWVQQFAIGGNYQFFLECPEWIVRGVQLTAYYSHSKSHHLGDHNCGSVDSDINGLIQRSIAGAWDLGADVGFIIQPWCCAQLITSVGYDNVNYKRHLQGRKRVSGASFTVDFDQKLFWNLDARIIAHFRKAFNDIQAKLSWTTCFDCGELEIGIYGGHVWGKSRLPSTSSAGVELGFAFGIDNCCQFVGIPCDCDCCHQGNFLADWVRDPAVYQPQVLAISEYRNNVNN